MPRLAAMALPVRTVCILPTNLPPLRYTSTKSGLSEITDRHSLRSSVGSVAPGGNPPALHCRAVPTDASAPLEREEIFEIVRDRLADILEIDPATISEGQSFVDDLDADSLALIELVEALEETMSERTTGFRIEDEDLEDLKTVRDAIDYVHERAR